MEKKKKGKKENLKPNTLENRTKEEQRKLAQKAGIASGKKRNEQKKTKEILETLLSYKIPKSEKRESQLNRIKDAIKERFPEVKEEDLTWKLMIPFSLINKASNGDVRAMELLLDLIGEMPPSKQEVSILSGDINIVLDDEKFGTEVD